MRQFALLRLENGGNEVIFDCHAETRFDAVEKFKSHVTDVSLDKDGYGKLNNVSFCVAEYWLT